MIAGTEMIGAAQDMLSAAIANAAVLSVIPTGVINDNLTTQV